MELFADENRPDGTATPQPLRVLKRFGRHTGEVGRPGSVRGVSDSDESRSSTPEGPDTPLVVMRKRGMQNGRETPGQLGFKPSRTHRPPLPASKIFPDTDDEIGDDTIRASYDGNDQIAPLSSCGPAFSDPFSTQMPTRDPAVLVPRIVVTPAVRAMEGDRGAMWIAVEVSAELCQPPDGTFLPVIPVSNNGFLVPGTEPRQLGDRYGCIYDMDIQLIPLGNNCILEIIQEDEPTPR
ncbi:hypothetical protein CGLO_09108 [Colletotrichum gloeosporioides Cg-14]|uniref:Uncharacterized protein n=1 Tax=Colletotrichum gloeosporioides (strain Cg-14) TaxID=1237896 RepID=T0KEF8_COLGC|nr:hypothetical protein CGLO_09108 [Colletotrichum gloeosporioides Cg-14]